MTDGSAPVSAAQLRAARTLLGLTQAEAAAASGLALATLRRAEARGGRGASAATRARYRRALEAAGVSFLADDGEGGAGVRLATAWFDPGTRIEDLTAANDG